MSKMWSSIQNSLEHHNERDALLMSNGARETYRGLSNRLHEVEQLLLTRQDRPVKSIGIISEKNFDVVSLMLFAIKHSIAYVPIDPSNPISRIEKIIKDAGLSFVAVEQSWGDANAEWCTAFETKTTFTFGVLKIFDIGVPEVDLNVDVNLVLFTSGSTGVPKGVQITSENLYAFVKWASEEVDLKPVDRVSSIAPFYFDLSTFDIFSSLIKGASVVLFTQPEIRNPRFLTNALKEFGVSIMYTTPTILDLLLGFGKWQRHTYDRLRTIIFAGEAMRPNLLKRLADLWTYTTFYNFYGPTETNVVTFAKFESQSKIPEKEVPIGTSCPFASIHIGDHPSGLSQKEGLLWVSGASVSPGYVSISSDRFVNIDGTSWYNTGDIARISENGDIYYKGRNDGMIKRHGNRIELGEIESAASQILEGRVSAVFLPNNGSGRLVLFMESQGPLPNDEEIRKELITLLPIYMLPDEFISIEQMPMTGSHKVDINGLLTIYNDLNK